MGALSNPRQAYLTIIKGYRKFGLEDRAKDNPIGTSIPIVVTTDRTFTHLQCYLDRTDLTNIEFNKIINTACIAYYHAYSSGELPLVS